jgi:hypothetical protein
MHSGLVLCVLGGGLQESVYWLQQWGRLDKDDFLKTVRDKRSWILSLFLIVVATPLVSMVWFDHPAAPPQSKDYFLFGAGLPLLVKSGMGASLATESVVRLGPRTWLRRYLGMR